MAVADGRQGPKGPMRVARRSGSVRTCHAFRWHLLLLLAIWPAMQTKAVAGEPEEHLVAVVVTEGSAHQPYGEEVIDAVTAVADRISADGGVLGAPVRIAHWSENCSRDTAARLAEEIARLKPAAVIGHLCAGAALAAAPIYAKAGVLLIAPGVRHPALTRMQAANGLVLRLAGRDDRLAADTMAFIRSRYAGQSIAVVADRTRHGRTRADGFVAEARRQHLAIALDERIESGEKSYDGLAARIKGSGAGVVVAPAPPMEVGVLIRSLRRVGSDVPVVGTEILAVPAMDAIPREQFGRLVAMLPWSGLEGPLRHSLLPNGGAAPDAQREAVRRRAEAAIEVWVAAARRAGTTDARAIAAAARSTATPTAVGSLRFDETGDAVVAGYVPSLWLNGGWRPFGD